jgi:D-arabinose 1-dehydrogenase-like Zn-dependent alcohol dehydrogenase
MAAMRSTLVTGERSLIQLPKSLVPKAVVPYTDGGLSAYRAAKNAQRHLLPGQFAVGWAPAAWVTSASRC